MMVLLFPLIGGIVLLIKDFTWLLVVMLVILVGALGEFMLSIDPWFEVTPAVDRTISRIYCDTRFAKDKSPYKTTMWITFKRPIF
jgi:hypothetical protein